MSRTLHRRASLRSPRPTLPTLIRSEVPSGRQPCGPMAGATTLRVSSHPRGLLYAARVVERKASAVSAASARRLRACAARQRCTRLPARRPGGPPVLSDWAAHLEPALRLSDGGSVGHARRRSRRWCVRPRRRPHVSGWLPRPSREDVWDDGASPEKEQLTPIAGRFRPAGEYI